MSTFTFDTLGTFFTFNKAGFGVQDCYLNKGSEYFFEGIMIWFVTRNASAAVVFSLIIIIYYQVFVVLYLEGWEEGSKV